MATRIASVIGNGESRTDFDINTLKTIGMTVGCNAVHRDMHPDYLVCADKKMVVEVLSNNNNNCLLYTSPSPRDAYESRMPSSA